MHRNKNNAEQFISANGIRGLPNRHVAELVEPDAGGPGVAEGIDIRHIDQYGL